MTYICMKGEWWYVQVDSVSLRGRLVDSVVVSRVVGIIFFLLLFRLNIY